MRVEICPAAYVINAGIWGVSSRPSFSIGVIQVVLQVKQFRIRLARRPGLPSEIASALWQKGVHIAAFSVELEEQEEIFHLAVDKAAVAKQTFIENGWHATEESQVT
jgi:hypothetical protein